MQEFVTRNKEEFIEQAITDNLNKRRRCRFCDTIFYISEAKIFINADQEKIICCPNAPLCKGTIENWSLTLF